MSVPWPTLGHSRGGSLSNPMLTTAYVHIRPEGHREPRNFVTTPWSLIFVPLSLKSMPHYEHETNVSFVIMSLSNVTVCPNVCLIWMVQTLSMLLLVKCCSVSQKCDKKFYHFCWNESTKDMSKLPSHIHQSISN